MNKKQQNTMLAFAEWMDVNTEGYIITYTNKGETGMVLKGEEDQLVVSLASGMMEHPELRRIVLKAVGMAFHMMNNDTLS